MKKSCILIEPTTFRLIFAAVFHAHIEVPQQKNDSSFIIQVKQYSQIKKKSTYMII